MADRAWAKPSQASRKATTADQLCLGGLARTRDAQARARRLALAGAVGVLLDRADGLISRRADHRPSIEMPY
jgi:hypothetical protein